MVLIFVIFFTFSPCLAEETDSAQVGGGVKCTETGGWKRCNFWLEVSGTIDSTALKKIQKVFEETRESRKDINGKRVTLNSLGGDVASAMVIGRIFRQERMPVFIERGSVCASSCIFILAGATQRIISGRVGIHRPFFKSTSQALTPNEMKISYAHELDNIREYLREMNVSQNLVDDLLFVAPDKVRYLSPIELINYGITEVDPVEREVLDVEEAQKLGLERFEYMRRKAFAERACRSGNEYVECRNRIMKSGN